MSLQTAQKSSASIEPQTFSNEEAARYLGVSRANFYRLKARGVLPAAVAIPGTGDRFRKSDLDRFVRELKPAKRRPRAIAARPAAE